jgi:hypothetical protein
MGSFAGRSLKLVTTILGHRFSGGTTELVMWEKPGKPTHAAGRRATM